MQSLASFRNRHEGETMLVCGCGDSLNELDNPEQFLTIGVNDVGRRFQPDYLVVVNPRAQFKGDRFQYVETSQSKYIFTQLELGLRLSQIVKFRLGQYGGTDFSDPELLHYTRNSPYVAVCLAVQMGARRIGLLGVDFTDHHFFAKTGRHPLAGSLERINEEYKKLGAALASRGIELVNLSQQSRLTALTRQNLSAFSATQPRIEGDARLQACSDRKVFFVHYRFLSCGDVFREGLMHAAAELKIRADGVYWDDRELPRKIRAFAPDLVFVVHGRRCAQRWGGELREWKSAVWLVDEPYEVDDTSRWSSIFDTVFVNDPVTLGRHRNAYPLPVCFDPLVHSDPGLAREYWVGFIGGFNPVREHFLVRLAEEGLLSYVVGGPWKAPAVRRLCLAERLTPAESARLYQRTQIVLNVFRSVHHFNRDGVFATALNPRIFEALACGALVVTEPRPALAASFPKLPTFLDADALSGTVRKLLNEPTLAATLLDASRARLVGQDYTRRLASVLAVALAGPVPHQINGAAVSIDDGLPKALAGWVAIGSDIATDAEGGVTLVADVVSETGLASKQSFGPVRLSFEARLDEQCRFIAKLHHAVRGDREADSYHLLATPELCYIARHGVVLASITFARNAWRRVEMTWNGGVVTVVIDGREACRRWDATLASGYCLIGVNGGSATVRSLRIEPSPPADRLSVPGGWSVQGTGTLTGNGSDFVLSAESRNDVSLVSEEAANDIELAFSVRLDAGAHFIAKIHHQVADDPDANSYHLITTPAHCCLARHDRVLAKVQLRRCMWQQVLLRWIDQRLELFVNGKRCAQVGDNLLQSGYCVVGVTAGRAEVSGLAIRDLSTREASSTPAIAAVTPKPGRDPIPFTETPRRNLIYHIWPVRGEMWRWNLEQIRSRIDLFNGRRIIGIVHDERSEDPDVVRDAFAGHGCEFVEARNGPSGEGLTFPTMLAHVRSLDPNEVTFYAHAKGVKYEPSIPKSVQRWSETQYRTALDHWPSVRSQLERFATTGSFKMLGRFRAHRYVGDWHYSGAFFWLRHAFVFARNVGSVQSFYGCVEAWPGVHFHRDETGCLFMEGLRQLPYSDEFWQGAGNPAFAKWEVAHPPTAPPEDLVKPPSFEGWASPRLEQKAEEFNWLLEKLASASPHHILSIGSMHGGVEWHVARRFRALGRDIHITAVDIKARPELLATLDDARKRFSQPIELVVGDSTSSATRASLAAKYDAVFIDGDHSYCRARADLEFAISRTPRLIALHDIVDSDWHAQARCSVSRLWAEVRSQYPTEDLAIGHWGGIGIVWL
jgi:hypothetical protein